MPWAKLPHRCTSTLMKSYRIAQHRHSVHVPKEMLDCVFRRICRVHCSPSITNAVFLEKPVVKLSDCQCSLLLHSFLKLAENAEMILRLLRWYWDCWVSTEAILCYFLLSDLQITETKLGRGWDFLDLSNAETKLRLLWNFAETNVENILQQIEVT